MFDKNINRRYKKCNKLLKVNVNFGKIKETIDIDKIIEKIEKGLKESIAVSSDSMTT